VAQLGQMGIPAALLNSSLSQAEQRETLVAACQGRYRLLYVAPERLVRADSMSWLKRVPASFFAIDEAHCISEWGHEFRPEYRQLGQLRAAFPDKPIGAFTASATQRVRHDILHQLQLRDPHKYIASFNRPNLNYIVKSVDKDSQPAMLLAALAQHEGENVIIYAPTIKAVEHQTAELNKRGIPAIAYHGQMDNETRRRNQESWMSEEVPVLVGTLAFGLGINKASVRAVIHLSLPKSLEQYYQEAGRAGRDGEPADCVLLWRKQDAGLLVHFIQQIQDAREKERAWERYNVIRRFAERNECRHLQICRHFGETPKWERCNACDVCCGMPEWLAAGSAPMAVAKVKKRPASHDLDRDLVARLKEWRRETAKARNVPPYVVLHDSTLNQLVLEKPVNTAELLRVAGMGEKKAASYGKELLALLRG
jgi:ATP-dependent DNA helicase RecQ